MDDLVARLRPGVECAPWVIEEVKRLQQEAAELRKDVARYRWLRGNYSESLALVQAIQVFTPEQLDAAIDNTIGEKK